MYDTRSVVKSTVLTGIVREWGQIQSNSRFLQHILIVVLLYFPLRLCFEHFSDFYLAYSYMQYSHFTIKLFFISSCILTEFQLIHN